jgi:DNA-binding transcriptional regulator YhcF (GntR family)
MDFIIEKNVSVPVVKQIQEQIQLAVAMGVFQSGDALPSIREIGKQTGVNRGQIHRAFLALKQSGLLVPNRGKGTVIAGVGVSPRFINKKCLRLSKSIVLKARQSGVSPTAFVRYLSGYAQEDERKRPFICYVDPKKEIAVSRAEEVSHLWQVPVIGLTTKEAKAAVRTGSKFRKVLANHLMRDSIRSQLPARIDVIPVEVRYTERTIRLLAGIKSNSSVLRILPPNFFRNAPFIIAQLRKWVRSPGIEISAISLPDERSLGKLLKSPKYDRVLVDPGILSEIPGKMRNNSRILIVRMQLDPASLETARIRAGVII